MKKRLIGLLVCTMMILVSTIPAVGTVTNQISEQKNSSEINTMNENYNLVQQLNPTRKIFPHIYRPGTVATFDAYVINEGPEETSNYTIHLKWSRIFGGHTGVIIDRKWGEYGPLNSGYRRHVYLNLECWINGMGINIYEVQVTNTANDLNPDDNIATIRYIVIGIG